MPQRAMPEGPPIRKVAVVTGGLGGIGQEIAAALSRRGFDMVALDRMMDPVRVDALAVTLATGIRLVAVEADIADIDDRPRAIAAIVAAFFGRLDRLVNNAGVSAKPRGDLLDVASDSYDANFAVDTRGTSFLTQAICRRMVADTEARFDRLLDDGFTPINRWDMPEDVGPAVATLASGDLPFATGAAIQVDGGMHIHHN